MKASPDAALALSLRLIKAHELARHGRTRDAAALLSPHGQPPDDPLALHTLAALATREGDYPRALSLWKTLLKQDPKNTDAPPMIDAIETWMLRPSWYGFLPAAAGTALILLVAVVAWRALSHATPAPVVTSPMVAAPANPAASKPAAAKPAAPAKEEPPPVKFQLAPRPKTPPK